MALKLDDFLKQPSDPAPFLCYPLLPKDGLMVIAAQSKSYKSMIALNIGYELTEGGKLFEIYDVKRPCRVLIIEQEIGEHRLKERLARIDQFKRGSRAGTLLWLTSKDLDCNLDTEAGIKQITEHIKQAEPEVVIFDPLQWFHSRPENDNTEMQKVMKQIYRMQKEHKFASVLVHHMAKKSEFRDGRSPESSRGASVVFADCDTFVTVNVLDPKREPKVITCDFTCRSAENPPPCHLEFDDLSMSFRLRS